MTPEVMTHNEKQRILKTTSKLWRLEATDPRMTSRAMEAQTVVSVYEAIQVAEAWKDLALHVTKNCGS